MVKKASPGVAGIGDNGPAQADIRIALATDLLFDAKKKDLNEHHKRARSGFGEKGIGIEQLKWLKTMKDMAPSEIIAEFTSKWHFIGAVFQELPGQMDLFTAKGSDPKIKAAHYTMGMLAGLQNKPLIIPPAIVGDDRNEMIKGHADGMDAFAAGQEAMANSAAPPKAKEKPGDKTAAKVGAKAAEDFAKDNVIDPLMVNGVKHETMRAANAARKRLQDQREQGANPPPPPEPEVIDGVIQGPAPADAVYFLDSEKAFPADHSLAGRRGTYKDGHEHSTAAADNAEVKTYLEHAPAKAKDAAAPATPAVGFDEASADELAQQKLRQGSDAPVVDEDEAKKMEKALKEKGFVPEKPAKGARRAPAGVDTRGSK